MNVDLGKNWCLVTIWNQTSNVMVHNALNTEGVYTTSSISKLFVDICSEGTNARLELYARMWFLKSLPLLSVTVSRWPNNSGSVSKEGRTTLPSPQQRENTLHMLS